MTNDRTTYLCPTFHFLGRLACKNTYGRPWLISQENILVQLFLPKSHNLEMDPISKTLTPSCFWKLLTRIFACPEKRPKNWTTKGGLNWCFHHGGTVECGPSQFWSRRARWPQGKVSHVSMTQSQTLLTSSIGCDVSNLFLLGIWISRFQC